MIQCDPRVAPPDGALFDFEHPLAQGMIMVLLPNATGNMVDWCRDRASGLTTSVGGSYGPSLRDWTVPNGQIGDLQFASGDFTVASLFGLNVVVPNSEYPTILSNSIYTNESVNVGWSMHIRPPNDTYPGYAFIMSHNAATNLSENHGGTPTAGNHLLVATHASAAGGNLNLYLDGALVVSNSSRANPVASTSGLFNLSQATSRVPAYVGYAWGRQLSASDVAWLNAEPFPFFRLPVYRTLIDLGRFSPILGGPRRIAGIGGGSAGPYAHLAGNK